MPPAGGESVIVEISIRVGIAALALTALFIVSALMLRGFVTRRQQRQAIADERWLPVMLRSLRDSVEEVPRLRRRDQAAVLASWNRLASALSGDGVKRLQSFARSAGLTRAAHHLVLRGRPAEQLVATVFFGHQQDLRASAALRRLVRRPEPIVRAEAARALVRLDPASGARMVAPLLIDWEDCHPATAVAVLSDAPPEVVVDALGAEVLRTADPHRQTRILEIMGAIRSPRAADIARVLLGRTIDPELIARNLEIMGASLRPDDAVLVRRFLHHDVAFVRLRALTALSQLQARGDEWRIVGLLDDPDWWVRHRAAEATLQSPRFDRRFVELLARIHPDRYARGALDHVLTERTL